MMETQGHVTVPEVWFRGFSNNKNSNQDIMDILYAAPDNHDWISTSIPELSRSGSQYIVPRVDGNWFKIDGFTWQRRKTGNLVREDHSKLKVNKIDRITCLYVTSAIVKGFQRRVYNLLDTNEFVMIHYLYIPEGNIPSTSQLVEDIVAHIQKNQRTDIVPQRLHNQLQAILAGSYDPLIITQMADEVCQRLNKGHVGVSTKQQSVEHDQRPSTSYNTQTSHLERRNSCSSAFRKGLSSMALRRQPSTFSDSVDTHFIGTIINNTEMADRERKQMGTATLYHVADDVRSYSGETQRSSNPDEDSSIMNPASLRSASAGAASHSSAPIQRPIDAVEIIDIAPSTSSIKGETKVLVIGEWYMKGHEYSIRMGEKKIPARLIRPGVLSFIVPPVAKAGVVMLQVICNEQIASQPRQFVYEDVDRDELLQYLADRLHLIGAAFGLPDSLRSLNSNMLDQEAIAVILRSLDGIPLMHPTLLNTSQIFTSRTILHLAALLDFSFVINQTIILRHSLGTYIREFDPLARDAEGCTPLHYAARSGNYNAARKLMELCPNSVDVLDDRNRTPADLAIGDVTVLMSQGEVLLGRSPTINSGEVRKQNVTALWVMTNGETVTDSHLLRDRRLIDEESTSTMSAFHDEEQYLHSSRSIPSDAPHLEISMDTDVDLPDSPKMADLFQAATSPAGVLNENNRQKMVSLAKQIINALPSRIKNDNTSLMDDLSDHHHHHQINGEYQHSFHLSPMIGATDGYWHSNGNSQQEYSIPMEQEPSRHLSYSLMNSRTSYTNSNSFEGTDMDFDKDLGEFFNLTLEGEVDPVTQRLGNLKLNDNEQRELYEAAMIIQRAYREYRERNSYRRQAEVECRAAVTIQSCYRRYKQYCYIKQLHSAAIVVQKHFRLKKGNQKEGTSTNEVQEHPTLEGQILRIQVPQTSSSLSREHRAATTIQTAYRGHRKRQAAARKIQKFMKENRQKLRRMAEQNVGDSSIATRQTLPTAGSLFQVHESHQHINE